MNLQYKIYDIDIVNHKYLIYLKAFTINFGYVEASILTTDNLLVEYCKKHIGEYIYFKGE